MKSTLLYLFLRAANSGLALAWGFLATYVLVRVLGVDEYSRYIVITAIGIYLSAVDMGLSKVIFSHLHATYLEGRPEEDGPLVLGTAAAYMTFAVMAAGIFALYLMATSPGKAGAILPQSLYLLFGTLNLPWMLLRTVGWAVEEHIFFDIVDFFRRTGQVALLVLLLAGADFNIILIALNVIWTIAFSVAWWRILPKLAGIQGYEKPGIGELWRRFLARYGRDVRASLSFSLLEFLIYNFPYAFVPAAYGKGTPLIAFDMYYKFFRAGIVANQVASTAFLPQQTKAFLQSPIGEVFRWTGIIFGMSALVSAAESVVIIFAGRELFGILLDGADVFDAHLAAAIVIGLFANSIQNTAGSLLLHVGYVRFATSLSWFMAAAIFVTALASVALQISVQQYILVYALTYAAGACLWGMRAISLLMARDRREVEGKGA